MCKHDGFYTCIGRYDRTAGGLVYFMVCDECHATLQSVLEQAYEPHFVNSVGGFSCRVRRGALMSPISRGFRRRQPDADPSRVPPGPSVTKGQDWGWGSTQTIGVLVGSVAVIGSFVLHCLRASNPLLDRDLFRRRSFTGASVVATLYSVAFGAFLLSLVLWDQNVWHWSALHTGLAIAPGPFLVLPTALLLAERLIARLGSGVVIAIGATLFAAGAMWCALFAGLRADYFADIFPGLLIVGVGVGLTLPTMMASATSELPPENFATGSAVVNMLRQVGLAIGVAVLVAVLGTPSGAHGLLDAFDHAWLVISAFAAASALASLAILGLRRPAPHSAPTGATVPIDRRAALAEET